MGDSVAAVEPARIAMYGRRPLVALVGPTCTGKTRLAVALAQRLWPAELLNADSRQLRRGLRAGTCAPTPGELGDVRCRLLDLADPGDDFTVAHWLATARAALDELEPRGVRPIVVGGTGLYVTALVDGYDLAGVPPDATTRNERTRLAATVAGREQLAAELTMRDPSAARTVDVRNPRRVIRALEIVDATGGLRGARRSDPLPVVMIGLDAPREVHERWVRQRCAAMFESGAIVADTQAALDRGHRADDLRACGIGYAESLQVVAGTLSVAEAVAETTRRTVRYARSQRTYFRRDRRITWLDATGTQPDLIATSLDVVTAAEVPAHNV